MAVIIGIDAGGTYTDAVAYSTGDRRVLGFAKRPTTRDDLLVGIAGALDALPIDVLRAADAVNLSTTLATNACVENKGGLGRLVLLNVSEAVLDWVGDSYGLPPRGETCMLSCDPGDGDAAVAAWLEFIAGCPGFLDGAVGVAIVQLDAARESAVLERALREHIISAHGLTVICGHELFSELNSLRRAASTLLNVRLIPIIGEFLDSVKRALNARGVHAPVTVVRSDGSLMSDLFTGLRPVETLLCGPAAGVIGGAHITGERDSLIIDMGGTTTDISIVRGGRPLRAGDGVNIGGWRTFVKGVFVDTFGLGGDSAVRLGRDRELTLGTRRLVPLCALATERPDIKQKLKSLIASAPFGHTTPLHEFFILGSPCDSDVPAWLSERERALCAALRDGPLSYEQAAAATGTDVYTLDTERLEQAGVVMRSGLTPTDIMHIKGDFCAFDGEASALGAEFVALGARMGAGTLCDAVYDMVKKRLYVNIVRILLCDGYARLGRDGIGQQLEELADINWGLARNKPDVEFLSPLFHSQAALVGIGAPIHIFLPDVAKALGTHWVVPERAGVANALGAAVARVEAVAQVDITPDQALPGEEGYVVYGLNGASYTRDRSEAEDIAGRDARAAALKEAGRRGALGDIEVELRVEHDVAQASDGASVYLGGRVIATAVGGML